MALGTFVGPLHLGKAKRTYGTVSLHRGVVNVSANDLPGERAASARRNDMSGSHPDHDHRYETTYSSFNREEAEDELNERLVRQDAMSEPCCLAVVGLDSQIASYLCDLPGLT